MILCYSPMFFCCFFIFQTSVVAPLLALILADGKSLGLSVVPKALVEMSRTRMRETFASIMVKRIYTLEFDRSAMMKSSMRRGLENAKRNRGLLISWVAILVLLLTLTFCCRDCRCNTNNY